MCGFVGIFGGAWSSATPDQLRRMAGCVHHRGPDHRDQWLDSENRVGLAHNRLAIVELSSAGDQPMHSASGRYVIVYNGEIYNHKDLRRQLEEAGWSTRWRGHSDTETLLACIEAWGLAAALTRLIGMFAFALWDRRERQLILARDRLGEKPLYYGWQGTGSEKVFLFGSELKALAASPAFVGDINREAITLLMRHNYIPAPYSIYQGISKLLPGSFASISMNNDPDLHCYWSASHAAEAGVADPLQASAEQACEELEQLLSDAVGQQLMSDVPLGAFLSGGVDSSTVVALMQKRSSRPVKTFSIGFHEHGYNEAHYAKAVAQHLGTEHTEMYVTPEQAMAVIPRLPLLYDEPFSDSSQIPTFLVSQLARQHVTVSLSGDGGDELFGGYNRYTITNKFWKAISKVPRPVRKLISRGVNHLSQAALETLLSSLGPITPKSARGLLTPEKARKAAGILASGSVTEVYRGLVSHWLDPAGVVVDGSEPITRLTGGLPQLKGLNDIEKMMALDLITYLPDDILVKVDRAAMGVSLETRVPFLDHRVVEFAWRLPLAYKLRDGQSKWPLRQVLYKHVPRSMIERPKAGFGVPIGSWLRGPLREWAEELLDETRIRQSGYLRPEPIRAAWEAHLSGRSDMQYHLWDVLMFQAWINEVKGVSDIQIPAAA